MTVGGGAMTMRKVLLERDDSIAVLTFNRPEKHNTFNKKFWNDLNICLDDLEHKLPRVVIVTGAGNRAFSAGFDINPDNPLVSSLVDAVMLGVRKPVEELIRFIRTSVDRLVTLPAPVIAAVNGLAYGGGAELAVRCDLRVADPGAVFSFSEMKLGLMPDHGGTVGLQRLVGTSRAVELILSGKKVSAAEAYKIGLVNQVSEPGRCLDSALDLAKSIAANGPRAVRASLAVLRRAGDLQAADALELESRHAVDLILSRECVEGIAAFMSGKQPEFKGPP
ncbi:MAG: enoyl-CoA hydratase [Syntrophus sp. (in: bacteria)]|nr:enoyl-CoA hydratase [Syntrophus sp. (in: bacteria)]